MKDNFVLSCCSTLDITAQKLNELGLEYACFKFYIDGKEYIDDLGQSLSHEEFFKAMENGADTSTSQVNEGEFLDFFRGFLEKGKDVLHISFSSGLSGTYQSALMAATALSEEFPERKLYVVDSLAAASGYGLFMQKLSELRESGMSIDELRDFAEANKNKLHHWFFTTDLKYLVKGGRVSKASGFLGGVLGICPLMDVNNLGKLTPRFKIRGKNKVIKEIVQQMKLHAQNGLDYSEKCFICHSACMEDAQAVASLVEENFKSLNGKVEIFDIGTTIGSHTGPGTVALFFWGDERVE